MIMWLRRLFDRCLRVFHFLQEKHALEAIAKQRLKVARFIDLNDPFELFAAELSDGRRRRALRDVKKRMDGLIGLLCFSKNWKNPLLWSHYGDKHRGIALEFEVSEKRLHEVSYASKRLRDIHNAAFRTSDSEEDVYRLLTTKYMGWKYEEEVRAFVNLSDCIADRGMHFFPFNEEVQLNGLVHGVLCQMPVREITRILPVGKELTVKKARLAFRSFSIVRNKVNKITVVKGEALI